MPARCFQGLFLSGIDSVSLELTPSLIDKRLKAPSVRVQETPETFLTLSYCGKSHLGFLCLCGGKRRACSGTAYRSGYEQTLISERERNCGCIKLVQSWRKLIDGGSGWTRTFIMQGYCMEYIISVP